MLLSRAMKNVCPRQATHSPGRSTEVRLFTEGPENTGGYNGIPRLHYGRCRCSGSRASTLSHTQTRGRTPKPCQVLGHGDVTQKSFPVGDVIVVRIMQQPPAKPTATHFSPLFPMNRSELEAFNRTSPPQHRTYFTILTTVNEGKIKEA